MPSNVPGRRTNGFPSAVKLSVPISVARGRVARRARTRRAPSLQMQPDSITASAAAAAIRRASGR